VKALQHRLEYVLLRLLVGALSLLPDRVAGTVGAVLGRLGYWPFRIRRRQAEENVRAAFPDRDDAWVQRVVRASYEHLGRELMVILRMPSKTPEQIRAMTRVHGIELGDARYREGKGVVVTAGHLGNWEMGAAMVAVRGYRVDAIVMRQANPLFDDYIVRTRKRLGIGVIRRGGATQAAVQSLQEGKAVAFAADQNANRRGVFVPFFGRLASTHRGAALIALRTGAPMFIGIPVREPDGTYTMCLEPVDFDRSGDPDEAVWRGTAAFTARLEAAIREHPEQYLWQHRRWKTRPPEETKDVSERELAGWRTHPVAGSGTAGQAGRRRPHQT
jgi:Kdo2-lipid IVA lauroyltransferase/acyltransferase